MASLLSRQSIAATPSAKSRSPLVVALPRSVRPLCLKGASAAAKVARTPLACRASASQPGGSAPARHAVLHDFCMVIPYGAIAVAGGVALFFLNFANLAGTALVAGATSIAASVLSLQEWKAGGDTKLYTLTSAGCSGFVAYTAGTALSALKGLPYWLALALTVFSAAAAAFCLYNVAAGGNPPPKGGKGK